MGSEMCIRDRRSLKTDKAEGSDGIKPIFLKFGATQLSKPLTFIFNKCIEKRLFPKFWKRADIHPIPKTAPPHCDELRPISLLPVVSKVFERILLRDMKSRLTETCGSKQFAYRTFGSTTSALIAIHDTVTKMLDEGDSSAVRLTQFDLSKAFDRLSHCLLIEHLHKCGLPNGFIKWCRSYLQDRLQCIKINNQRYRWRDVVSGVPQGSVFGPYLFASFMGSLNIEDNSNQALIMYADDMTLLEKIKKNSSESNENVNKIIEWIEENGLKENKEKRKQLFFRIKSAVPSSPNTHEATSLKILGVVWENNLKWNRHVGEMLLKASRRMHAIRILLPHLGRNKTILVYHSIVTSVLSYASPLFVGMSTSAKSKIVKMQKRHHKAICGKQCQCDRFPNINDIFQANAKKLFLQASMEQSHLLHSRIPPLSSSGRYRQPPANTTRRLNSFIVFTCNSINENFRR